MSMVTSVGEGFWMKLDSLEEDLFLLLDYIWCLKLTLL